MLNVHPLFDPGVSMSGDTSAFFDVKRENQIATISVLDTATREKMRSKGGSSHWEMAKVLNEIRTDNSIRVIVITGAVDGEFWCPPPQAAQDDEHRQVQRSSSAALWRTFTGTTMLHEVMAEIEKPIVARVNGDAVGTGASVLFNSDLSVAVEDAMIVDHHMSMGELDKWGAPFGMVPGDGGLALAPLHMPPMMMKEFLMLAKPFSARAFADLGIINYAVARSELDAVVDDLVARLLRRSSYALAWTKRVANRQTVAHMNMTWDAASAYEHINFLQHQLLGEGKKYTLD